MPVFIDSIARIISILYSSRFFYFTDISMHKKTGQICIRPVFSRYDNTPEMHIPSAMAPCPASKK
jgi:hypothetical protein